MYRYKGLTLEPYRGRRFHAITMARTLDEWRARGYRGMLAYVDANNLSSLKSVYRLGYVTFGRVFILRLVGRHLIFNSPGCKAFGFRVVAERRRARSRIRTWGAMLSRWMTTPLFLGGEGESRGARR